MMVQVDLLFDMTIVTCIEMRNRASGLYSYVCGGGDLAPELAAGV